MNNSATNSAASIYGRRKTTSDLSDNQFASELNQYQQRKGDNVAIQKAQMDQQIKQHRELRLPQERLQQTRNQREEALQGNRFGSFTQPAARQATPAAPAPSPPQGRPTQQQLIAAQQKQRAISAQQRVNQENRFELYYSKSSRGSLQNAEVIMQGLSNYFTDGFIRQHVLAINFDDSSNIGRVHEAILNNERYLAIIQMDCILFDKFESYIILPEHNILRILKNHCQSFAPKQSTPPNERQWQMDRARQQAMYEQQRAEAEAQAAQDAQHNMRTPFAGASRNTQEAMNRQRPVVDIQDAAPMPPRGMAGFSAMAKQVGADLNSPSSDVKLHHVVPHASNSLMTAQTLEEVEALPASNMDLIYGKNKGCTLGYGNDLQKIEQEFVAAHNASNPTNREITSQSMMKPPKKRTNETQMLNTQRVAPRAPAPPAGPNLQHLQGLERSPMEELGGRSVKGGEQQQQPQKKFQQFQVTKPKKSRQTASE